MENYYEDLNVINFAEIEVIKASYKALSKKYHPDLNKGVNPEMMIKINNAYDVLSDINKKKEYDKQLRYYLENEKNFEEKQERKNEFNNFNIDDLIYKNIDKIHPFRLLFSIIIGIILAFIGSFIVIAIVPSNGSWSFIAYTVYGSIIGLVIKFIAKSSSLILGGIGFGITLICMVLPYYIYLYDVMTIVYGEMGFISKFITATQEVANVLLGSGFIRLIFVILTPCATFSSISD